RWMQTALAGVEEVLFPELVESDVVLTNGAGLHATSIPEHVLAVMFALARNLHHAQRLQAEARWGRFDVIAFAGGIRELAGSRLAILGAGPIGTALVPRARALGMTVRVLRRRPGVGVEGADAFVGPESLHELLGWADFVVLALPLTAETNGLIGREAIEAMRSSAFLVNVARGEVVDDDALVDALRRGRIAGAALDAFRTEPLPPDSPWWTLPNVIVTPHVSGYAPDYFAAFVELWRDNLRRWTQGRPLRNVVDKRLGYAVP
ncbi:MAG: D-2-hydroxyacid dehydrogenase, partial [Alphaproteobacteria bacterium]